MDIQKNDILIRMKGMQDSMPKACRQICGYVLRHPNEVLHFSVHTLAQSSGVSDATVIRFCRFLGFDGYRAFMIALSAALTGTERTDGSDPFTDIRANDTISSIVDNIAHVNRQSIDDTLTVLDCEKLDVVVEKLLHAERIVFCGLGASGLVCMDAEQKFLRIGKLCHAFTDGHSQLTAAALLGKRDVALLVSNSGETADILDTLRLLKTRGVYTVSLTRYGKNRLAENSDTALYISTPEILFRSGAMGSRIAMLSVVDIIFASIVSRSYNQSKKRLFCTRQALESKRECRDNVKGREVKWK